MTSCISCGPGTFQPWTWENSLGTFCTVCTSAYSELPIGSTQCVSECGPGRYAANCTASQNVSGTLCSFGVSYCAECSAGTYWTGQGALSALWCEPCGSGTFSSRQGQSTCSGCTEGYYLSQAGASMCVPCWAGSFGTASSAVSQATCVECEAGTYSSISGQSSCSQCPSGSYSSSAGAAACSLCGAGNAPGTQGAASSTTCQPCSNGQYSSAAGQGQCSDCLPGSYTFDTAATFVLFAQQGHICNILNVYQSATVFTFQRSRRWRVAYLLDSA